MILEIGTDNILMSYMCESVLRKKSQNANSIHNYCFPFLVRRKWQFSLTLCTENVLTHGVGGSKKSQNTVT